MKMPEESQPTQSDGANLHGGSLIRMGASAGAIAFDVSGASLESGSLQEDLGLLVSRAQRKLICDYKQRPDDQEKDAKQYRNKSFRW